MMMSDGAEDRQGESGAVTLRGLKLEAGLKKVLINNDVLWLRGPILTLSPKSQDVWAVVEEMVLLIVSDVFFFFLSGGTGLIDEC